jgi:hypothetical protein
MKIHIEIDPSENTDFLEYFCRCMTEWTREEPHEADISAENYIKEKRRGRPKKNAKDLGVEITAEGP